MTEEAAPRTAKRRRNRWAIIALIVLAVLIVGFFAVRAFTSRSSTSTSNLQTAQVTQQTMTISVSGDGSTVPVDTTDVFSQSSGKVDVVYVSVGDSVKKGAALFRLDSTSLYDALLSAQAQLKQSKQSVEQAEQSLKQAQLQQLQAQQTLHNLESQPATVTKPGQPTQSQQIAVAKKQLQIANHAVEVADVGLCAARANLTSAQNSYDDALDAYNNRTTYAPAGGTATAVNITAGQSVSGGGSSNSSGNSANSVSAASSSSNGGNSSAPVVISDVSDLMATVSINEVDIAKVKVGQEATVTFDAVSGLEIPGKVSFVSPTGTTSNGVVTYSCNITFEKQNSQLRPDMNATADIISQTIPNAIVVPNAAIKVNGTQNFIEVLQPDGSTVNHNVTIGVQNDTYTQITSGAKPGETVVVSSGSSTTSGGGRGFLFGGGGPPGGGGSTRSTGGTTRSTGGGQ